MHVCGVGVLYPSFLLLGLREIDTESVAGPLYGLWAVTCGWGLMALSISRGTGRGDARQLKRRLVLGVWLAAPLIVGVAYWSLGRWIPDPSAAHSLGRWALLFLGLGVLAGIWLSAWRRKVPALVGGPSLKGEAAAIGAARSRQT